MVQHVFSMFIYGAIGYALMSAIFAGLWGIRMLRFKQAEIRAKDLEPIIRGWLDDSDLSTKSISNPTWNFGLLVTLPDGASIRITQMKEHPGFIAVQADLGIPPEHQAVLKAMPLGYFEKLAQEIVLSVFLANAVLTIRTRLSDVSFFAKLAITAELTQEEFLKRLYDMDNAVTLARNAILLAVERSPRLVLSRNGRENRLGREDKPLHLG